MSAFIHALYETNMVGVARYVWRKDSQPKVMALIPKIKTNSEVSGGSWSGQIEEQATSMELGNT